MRALVVAWMTAIVLVSSGCDGGRARPGGPNVGSPARDATAGRPADAGEVDDGGEVDAGVSLDASDPSQRGDAVPFDARPAPDALPGQDALPARDAAPAADATSFDAAPARDAAAPGADALPADALAPDASSAPDAMAPDAFVPPPVDGGVRGDAGTAACTSDAQCASGRCHPLYGQCVPQGQRPYCDTCTTDSECGLPGDHCLDVSAGGMFLERICAQACSAAADCPRGYTCSLGGHCYPISGSIRPHTCASLRDMLARESCNSFSGPDTCGIPGYDDGTCVPTLGCTVGCVNNSDCPERSTCTPYVVADYCVAQ